MYDLIVIGGGPGGYCAAERAGAAGKKVLLIEQDTLGGVCLNRGCIPTKSLLNAAKHYIHAKEGEDYGVTAENVSFSLEKAMAWKNKTVKTLVKGVEYQMKRHKVEVVMGKAIFTDAKTVEVSGTAYTAENIIIAAGSSTFIPPIPGVDQDHVLTSTEILNINEIPESLVVIGGGVIGLEFASFFSTLGIPVHVIEMMDEVVPLMDPEFSELLRKSLTGVTFHLGAKVEAIDGKTVKFTKDGKPETINADIVLMSVGRRPNVNDYGLEKTGVEVVRTGIKVDEHMRTNVPGIYAIGDVTGESLLAHSAYRMAEVAVHHITGRADRWRNNAIPWVVYTLPEASGCGLTEKDAKEKGLVVKTASLQMRANGRFIAENGTSAPGLCKIIADAETDVVLGVHMLGGINSEMIWGVAALLETELRVEDVKEIIFPHPTVSEIIKDTLWEFNHA